MLAVRPTLLVVHSFSVLFVLVSVGTIGCVSDLVQAKGLTNDTYGLTVANIAAFLTPCVRVRMDFRTSHVEGPSMYVHADDCLNGMLECQERGAGCRIDFGGSDIFAGKKSMPLLALSLLCTNNLCANVFAGSWALCCCLNGFSFRCCGCRIF